MNILFVMPYPPSRIRVRSFELLRTLAKRQHTLTLATIWSSPEDRQDLELLRKAGIRVVEFYLPALRSLTNTLLALPTSTPLQAVYCWHPRFADLVIDLALDSKADVLHIEHLRGARYGIYVKERLAAKGHRIPIIWDSVDCITHLFRQAATQSHSLQGRLMSKLELGRTSHYEGWLLQQFDRTLVTSAADKVALEKLASGKTTAADGQEFVQILPNGVDIDHFAPIEEPRLPATLVLTGKMSYHANITAAQHLVQEIMPLVWAKRADVAVWIVGKDPTRAVMDLERANGAGAGKVKVIGTVPDMRTYLHQATIAVAPVLYGAGVQNKVLEAMACGAPVIASEQAVSALQTKDGDDLTVRRTIQGFADAILTVLGSPSLQAQFSREGRVYVEHNHTWSASAMRLETIYTASTN